MNTTDKKREFYILIRDGETKIVAVVEGGDPLHGNGSWNILAGPGLTEMQCRLAGGDWSAVKEMQI